MGLFEMVEDESCRLKEVEVEGFAHFGLPLGVALRSTIIMLPCDWLALYTDSTSTSRKQLRFFTCFVHDSKFITKLDKF
jgi:hypothetical protein